jgi:cytidyltransferase-like protein
MKYLFALGALGGTFDHFHKGHRKLLDTAFAKSKNVIVGITPKELSDNKLYSHAIESYIQRKTAVEKYLSSKGFLERAEITELNDIYGPTKDRAEVEAVFATESNAKNVEAINAKREENGLKPLYPVIIDYEKDVDGNIITSSRIRSGEIDREGNSYFSLFAVKKRLKLPERERPRFKKPIGKVIKKLGHINNLTMKQFNNSFLIAVGDIASINLYKSASQPDICIIDHRTRRGNLNDQDKKTLAELTAGADITEAENQAGMIERRAVGAIRKALESFAQTGDRQIVTIKGEEDLLVIPSILLSPLESTVIYGQPDQGLVVVKVTEKKKREATDYLSYLR